MSSGPRKLKTFDEDDIVKYSLGLDVPIVGLVRDRGEYKEMREIALIHGTVLGIGAKARAAARAAEAGAAPAVDAPSVEGPAVVAAPAAPEPAVAAPEPGEPANA